MGGQSNLLLVESPTVGCFGCVDVPADGTAALGVIRGGVIDHVLIGAFDHVNTFFSTTCFVLQSAQYVTFLAWK